MSFLETSEPTWNFSLFKWIYFYPFSLSLCVHELLLQFVNTGCINNFGISRRSFTALACLGHPFISRDFVHCKWKNCLHPSFETIPDLYLM